ncbi:MAG: pyridoxal phosphate-dependent aminotransferase [Gammaproteobacteria bacterium]|nr:pyridoxal phosphate-dependent aminotransferase [Gammaproteobacteria bacterium]
MDFDFDTPVERRRTRSYKWDDTRRAFGKPDLLPFWVADMDFATPAPILDAIQRRCRHPSLGYEQRNDEYRETVQAWLRDRHQWNVPLEWLMFCPPTSILGIYGLVTTLTEPGSSIVTQSPTYGPLQNLVVDNGRRLIRTLFREVDNKFVFDIGDLADKIEADTGLFLLCSPHNPTGRVFSDAELRSIANLADARDLVVISDEVHADLVMPGHRHRPYGSIGGERSVTVISPNKTFNTAGIPQATLVIPDPAIREKFQGFLDIAQINHDSTFGAVGMIAAYRDCSAWLDALLRYIAANHERVAEFLSRNVAGVRCSPAEATYLAWLDCRATGLPEDELMQRFVEKGGIALYGGSEFGPDGAGFFRMNVACPRSTLERGLRGIKEALA